MVLLTQLAVALLGQGLQLILLSIHLVSHLIALSLLDTLHVISVSASFFILSSLLQLAARAKK